MSCVTRPGGLRTGPMPKGLRPNWKRPSEFWRLSPERERRTPRQASLVCGAGMYLRPPAISTTRSTSAKWWSVLSGALDDVRDRGSNDSCWHCSPSASAATPPNSPLPQSLWRRARSSARCLKQPRSGIEGRTCAPVRKPFKSQKIGFEWVCLRTRVLQTKA